MATWENSKPEKVNLSKQVSIWYSITMFFEKRFFSENFQHLKKIKICAKTTKVLRASPVVLSMWSCTVKLDEEKWKYAGLAQENGFG
jgi:hypothetical protein